MSGDERILHLFERVYRALLVIYPRSFRDSFGPHMVQVFRDSCRDEVRRAGSIGLLVLSARTLWDLLSTAFAERSKTVVPLFSASRLIRLSGLAAMLGGTLGVLVELGSILYWHGFPYDSSSVLYIEGSLDLLGVFGPLLVAAGMLGLYVSMTRGPRNMAALGVILVCLSTIVLAVLTVYEYLAILSSGYPKNAVIPVGVYDVGVMFQFVGCLLLGEAVFKTRILGRWSALPLALGSIPLFWPFVIGAIVLLQLAVSPQGLIGESSLAPYAFLALPGVLFELGWVVVGYLLLSGRTIASERSPRVA